MTMMYSLQLQTREGGTVYWQSKDESVFAATLQDIRASFGKSRKIELGTIDALGDGFQIINMSEIVAVRAVKHETAKCGAEVSQRAVEQATTNPQTTTAPAVKPATPQAVQGPRTTATQK